MPAICVFCGSSPGADPEYARVAALTGELLATSGHTLVYGGSNVGLMRVMADAALARGGRVVGVIPEILVVKEVAHRGLTELRITASMSERKQSMADLSDAFLALPGGIGTLDEIVEMFVLSQLGVQLKPCGLLNTAGFFDPLIAFFQRMVDARFLRADQSAQLLVSRDPREIIELLLRFKPWPMDKWLDRKVIVQGAG
jgi:uncharacterized protein (TIGR00730 family)